MSSPDLARVWLLVAVRALGNVGSKHIARTTPVPALGRVVWMGLQPIVWNARCSPLGARPA